MNTPYVKIIENGEVKNPIVKSYIHTSPNRKKRREKLQKQRFMGNHKGLNLIVVNNGSGSAKYQKLVQRVPLFDKSTMHLPISSRPIIGYKSINHFIER